MEEKRFTPEQRKELSKFSYAFTLLKLLPVFLMLVFLGVLAVRLGGLGVDGALTMILGALVAVYFFFPFMAGKVMKGVMAFRTKKAGSTDGR